MIVNKIVGSYHFQIREPLSKPPRGVVTSARQRQQVVISTYQVRRATDDCKLYEMGVLRIARKIKALSCAPVYVADLSEPF